VRKSWPFVRVHSSLLPAIHGQTAKSIVRKAETNARPSTMQRGHSAVGAELGSAHRSSANDGYAGALYIPLSHCSGHGIDYYTISLALYLYETGTAIQRNSYWMLARADTAGGTLLPWNGSFYGCSRSRRFEAWRLAGLAVGH
jgi:hypothetical protein